MNLNQYYFPGHGLEKRWQRALARLGFHFAACMMALLLAEHLKQPILVSGAFSPELLEDHSTYIFALSYCSLVLIFPPRLNISDTVIGLFAALIWPIFGPGLLALAFSGLLVYLFRLYREHRFVIWWSVFPVINVLIYLFKLYPFREISPWYVGIFLVIAIIGVINVASPDEAVDGRDQTKAETLEFEQGRTNTKKSPAKSATTAKRARIQSKPKVNSDDISVPLANFEPPRTEQKIMEEHKKLIVQLLRQAHFLPEALAIRIVTISERARLILETMESDPRDFVPGDKFLSRYLTATFDIMDNVLKLSGRAASNESFEKVLVQSESLLARLESAFAEQHLRLLENDTIDLVSELNVLDKLLKMEGFK